MAAATLPGQASEARMEAPSRAIDPEDYLRLASRRKLEKVQVCIFPGRHLGRPYRCQRIGGTGSDLTPPVRVFPSPKCQLHARRITFFLLRPHGCGAFYAMSFPPPARPPGAMRAIRGPVGARRRKWGTAFSRRSSGVTSRRSPAASRPTHSSGRPVPRVAPLP